MKARQDTPLDVVVIGGGIAGLAATAALADNLKPCLVEREPVLASHASGRNAAIFRPLESESTTSALAQRSMQLMDSQLGLAHQGLLSKGLVLGFGSADAARVEARRAAALGVAHQHLDGQSLRDVVPSLSGGTMQAGLWLEDGGVLDIHGITQGLADLARRRGAHVRVGTEVVRLRLTHGRVEGVELATGAFLPCAHVVLAAGAWSAGLAARCGVPLPLRPIRRHLVHLGWSGPAPAGTRAWPVVWRQDVEVYFRPEGAGLLASPCDETHYPDPNSLTSQPDKVALELLAERLRVTAPALEQLAVRSSWGCFRTFAADRELVLGADPRVQGLHWLCGLGGRGMSVGIAAGELLAQRLLAGEQPANCPFRIERLLGV